MNVEELEKKWEPVLLDTSMTLNQRESYRHELLQDLYLVGYIGYIFSDLSDLKIYKFSNVPVSFILRTFTDNAPMFIPV